MHFYGSNLCSVFTWSYSYWLGTDVCSYPLLDSMPPWIYEAVWCIYASGKHTNIGSNNGLSPGRRQAIIWTNAWILLIWPLETNFSEIVFETYIFSFKKMYLKMSSGKWRPFRIVLNVLAIHLYPPPLLQQSDISGLLNAAQQENDSPSVLLRATYDEAYSLAHWLSYCQLRQRQCN